jgi:hypothetical protein
MEEHMVKKLGYCLFLLNIGSLILLPACTPQALEPVPVERKLTPIPLVEESGEAVEDCILTQKGHVEGQLFWERTGELSRDGQMVYLIFDGGPPLTQWAENSSYSFPMLARQCGDEVEWIGFSVRYGRGGEYVKPETDHVHLDIYSTGSGANTPADAKECVLTLGEIRGRILSNDKPVPDGNIVTAALGPAPITAERALQTVGTQDGYYTITSIGNRCGDKAFWMEWSLSALGEQISITPSSTQTDQDFFIAPSS